MAPLRSSKGKSTGFLVSLFQSSLLGRGIAPPPFTATGGNQTGPGAALEPGNGYAYHAFTSPGTLVAENSTGICEVLIVGGGGGGADYADPGNAGGGGGAGGLVHHTQLEIGVGSHSILVGSGGQASPSPNGAYIGADGGDTTAFGIVAKGGGGAGGYTDVGRSGGSGGGGGTPSSTGSGPATQPSQNGPFVPESGFAQYGNAGGNGNSGPGQFGAGGGAGAVGGSHGAAGGDGRQYPQFLGNDIGVPAVHFTNGYYAGGGGAGRYGSLPPSNGGLGGGGGINNNPSGTPSNTQPIPGSANTGGGGAGGSLNNSGGAGGSGIVIIRYSV